MRWLAPTLLLGGALVLLPSEARACSPWDPHVEFTVPAEGQVHPSNAAILVVGQVLDGEGLQATIDGTPATVVTDERSHLIDYFVWGPAYQILALRLEPQPQPGQQVHVFGEVCLPEAEMLGEPGCQGFELQFSAGPEDLADPSFSLDLWYDVYDHLEEATHPTSCGSFVARYSVDTRVELDEDTEAPTFFDLYRRPRDVPGQWGMVGRTWRLETGDEQPRGFSFRYLEEQAAELLPLAEAFCFELRSEDLAGNPGPSIERCLPCRDQFGEPDDGVGFIVSFPQGPPIYSNDWLYPDGYCPDYILNGDGSTGDTGEFPMADDTGGSSTSTGGGEPEATSGGTTGGTGDEAPGQEPGEAGCGCVAGSSRPRPGWALLLGLWWLGRGRRRRPGRRTPDARRLGTPSVAALGLLACCASTSSSLGCGADTGEIAGSTAGSSSGSSTHGESTALDSTTLDDGTAPEPATDDGGCGGYSTTRDYIGLVASSDGMMTWSTVIEHETMSWLPAVPDLDGGVIFASHGGGHKLARHAADGTRLDTLLISGNLNDMVTDGNGRVVYAGIFKEDGMPWQAGYVEVDQDLSRNSAWRTLPWPETSSHRVKVAATADGHTVVADGSLRGTERWIGKFDADGAELWSSPWPFVPQADSHGTARAAGVAVLDDGTIGMLLTSGDLYEGDLWLAAFDPDGQHAWTAMKPGRKTEGLTATADTFVVTSIEHIDAFAADGSAAWYTAHEAGGLVRPCPDGSFIAPALSGFDRLVPGRNPVNHEFDLLDLFPASVGDYEHASVRVRDAVCTTDGVVIVLVELTASFDFVDCHETG